MRCLSETEEGYWEWVYTCFYVHYNEQYNDISNMSFQLAALGDRVVSATEARSVDADAKIVRDEGMARNGGPSLSAEHNRLSHKRVFGESSFIAGTTAHIWYASTAELAGSISDYYAVLSNAEKLRAEKFRCLEDRCDYVLRRAVRRLILAQYVGCDPQEVEFGTNQHGKPFLLGSDGSIMFNAAHSKHVVLVGVTNGTELGIDVEYINCEFDWLPVARTFFSEHYFTDLKSRTGDVARALFFSMWTQTEAILKARGVGLSGIRETLELDSSKDKDFRIVPFELPGSFHGSLAVGHAIKRVHLYHYSNAFSSNIVRKIRPLTM